MDSRQDPLPPPSYLIHNASLRPLNVDGFVNALFCHSYESRDFSGLVYFTLVTSFAAFTKRTGHTYFTHGHLGTASAGRLKEYDRRVYGIEVHDPCHLGESCKRVHVLLETEIKFKIIEPWDRWFHAF